MKEMAGKQARKGLQEGVFTPSRKKKKHPGGWETLNPEILGCGGWRLPSRGGDRVRWRGRQEGGNCFWGVGCIYEGEGHGQGGTKMFL